MRVNLGSGNNKMEGYTNVDKFASANPDVVHDLSVYPWPFEDNSVEEVYANHAMEHLPDLCNVMKEIYRCCKNGARVVINVPHPAHDDFLSDPTHVTRILPQTMTLFSKKNCQYWKEANAANSPLADYYGINFEFEMVPRPDGKLAANIVDVLDDNYAAWVNDPGIETMKRQNRNVVCEIRMVMIAIKEPTE